MGLTLNPADLSPYGFPGSAGTFGGYFGSLTGGALLYDTQDYALYDQGGTGYFYWYVVGNKVTELASCTGFKVNGVTYPISGSPSFDGTYTTTVFSGEPFTVGVSCDVEAVGVTGQIGYTLLHAATIIGSIVGFQSSDGYGSINPIFIGNVPISTIYTSGAAPAQIYLQSTTGDYTASMPTSIWIDGVERTRVSVDYPGGGGTTAYYSAGSVFVNGSTYQIATAAPSGDITLDAGEIFGYAQGFSLSDDVGSISPGTIGGFTIRYLATESDNFIYLTLDGDATSYLTGKSITVNGVAYYPDGAPYYAGSGRIGVTYNYGANFVTGNSYSINLVSSGAGITGSLAATESASPCVFSASGTAELGPSPFDFTLRDPGSAFNIKLSDVSLEDITGTLAATEPADPDTLTSDGYVEVTADLAATESTTPDSLAATGSVAWPDRTGTLAATESTTPDSAAITGAIAVIGDLAATEPADADTFESTGYVTDPDRVAIMAATESATPDDAAFAGTVSISGSLAATDPAPDSAALIGQVNVAGTMSAPEVTTPDTATISGTVTVTAALVATEPTDLDTAAITGSVYWTTINGTLASVEDSSEDSAAISATVAVTGTLDASETGSDAFAANGQVFFPGRTGSLSVTEDPTGDSAALSGSVSISGQLAVIESLVDGMAAAGEVAVTGTLSSDEPTDSDSAEVTGSVYWQPSIGTLDATEDPTGDSASASGVVLITITADIVETDVDVFSATLYTSLQAVMAARESGSDRFLGGRIHATSASIPQVRETASRLQIRSTESEPQVRSSESEPQVRSTESEPQVRSSESEAQDRSSSSVAME